MTMTVIIAYTPQLSSVQHALRARAIWPTENRRDALPR